MQQRGTQTTLQKMIDAGQGFVQTGTSQSWLVDERTMPRRVTAKSPARKRETRKMRLLSCSSGLWCCLNGKGASSQLPKLAPDACHGLRAQGARAELENENDEETKVCRNLGRRWWRMKRGSHAAKGQGAKRKEENATGKLLRACGWGEYRFGCSKTRQ